MHGYRHNTMLIIHVCHLYFLWSTWLHWYWFIETHKTTPWDDFCRDHHSTYCSPSSCRSIAPGNDLVLLYKCFLLLKSKEQTVGLCGRRWEWDDLSEQHWNMFISICEIDRQSRFNAWGGVLGAGALGWPWGMGWGGRWEGGSGWGTHVHPWLIHVSVWQNHHNIVR